MNRLIWMLLLLPPALFAGEEAAPASKERFGLQWLSPKAGAAQAQKERKPRLVVVPGAEGDGYWKLLGERFLDNKKVQELLARFVVVEAAPGSAGLRRLETVLGSLENRQLVAILDFEGKLLARWKDEPPRRRAFRKAAKQAAEANQKVAQLHKAVEQSIAKARYALKQEKYRDSVLHVLAALKPELPAESELMQKAREVEAAIMKVYHKHEAEGQAAEDDKRYVQAIEKYDKMIRDFPFPERVKELRRRISELYNRIRQP